MEGKRPCESRKVTGQRPQATGHLTEMVVVLDSSVLEHYLVLALLGPGYWGRASNHASTRQGAWRLVGAGTTFSS